MLKERMIEMDKKINMGGKIATFSGILTAGTGVLSKDVNIFCAGLILGTAGITALECQTPREKRPNKKILIRTMYNNK